MKYALFIFFLFSSHTIFARSIESFKDSEALIAVSDFMEDASEDLPTASFINDKKRVLDASWECKDVSAQLVYKEVERAIKAISRFYPDEDIPFLEALVDLEDYLDQRNFKRCQLITWKSSVKTLHTYYSDLKNEIHLSLLSKTP